MSLKNKIKILFYEDKDNDADDRMYMDSMISCLKYRFDEQVQIELHNSGASLIEFLKNNEQYDPKLIISDLKLEKNAEDWLILLETYREYKMTSRIILYVNNPDSTLGPNISEGLFYKISKKEGFGVLEGIIHKLLSC